MAHSSGGGSHGGGTHSGSHGHSHSSSRSSGGSHGGASFDSVRISRHRFPGAREYVYYDRRGNYHYIYADYTPDKPDLAITIILSIMILVMGLGLAWFMMDIGLFVPRPISTSSYESGIYLESSLNIGDESAALDAMQYMLETTGVSPAVEVVVNAAWNANYTDLETFAFSEYYRLFDDESHWLVVISYPDETAADGFVNWQWEGIIGDDCESIISSEAEDRFTIIMQKYLLRSEQTSLGNSLASACDEFTAGVLAVQYDGVFLALSVIFALFTLMLLILAIRNYILKMVCYKAAKVPTGVTMQKCSYCDRPYVVGATLVCPGCGAPVNINVSNESDKTGFPGCRTQSN